MSVNWLYIQRLGTCEVFRMNNYGNKLKDVIISSICQIGNLHHTWMNETAHQINLKFFLIMIYKEFYFIRKMSGPLDISEIYVQVIL